MIIATFARTPACLLQSRYRAVEIYGELDLKKEPGSREKRTRGRNLFSERGLGCFRSVFARAISLGFWFQSVSALCRATREPLQCSL
jgi:hypothetical protein